jgi:hypothetical protein
MTRFFSVLKHDSLSHVPWLLPAASGLLQPLSESFLYRSPAEPRRLTCRLKPRGVESGDDRR